MNLLEAMERYIDWQRSHGAKFETSAHTLLRFAKGIGEEIDCDAVTPSPILDYLTFLANMDGTPLNEDTVYNAFIRLLRRAGIESRDDSRQAPRLHSLRHSFAVHRLTDWYRQGADVQRLLPVLSTYLGHARLHHTQVYLSMTPELLHQAALRFERYAGGGDNE